MNQQGFLKISIKAIIVIAVVAAVSALAFYYFDKLIPREEQTVSRDSAGEPPSFLHKL